MASRRKYSVEEIDELRGFIWSIYFSDSYGTDASRWVEERLRTLMLNGTDPDELREAADKARAESQKAHERWMAEHEARMKACEEDTKRAQAEYTAQAAAPLSWLDRLLG